MKNTIQDLMNHQFAMLETVTDPNAGKLPGIFQSEIKFLAGEASVERVI